MLEQHSVQHLEAVKAADPETGKQVEGELQNLFAQMQQAAAQVAEQDVQQTEEIPDNVENIPAGAGVG